MVSRPRLLAAAGRLGQPGPQALREAQERVGRLSRSRCPEHMARLLEGLSGWL
ncbi:hypothetical protein [Actinomyces lilanjuaniae]|uniref:hypothetical protein n=1 Tax=Actinomyces lilanjuaniae TaxID=2321394 RepID=UPI0013C5249C|nr:hypothetical protein [Actinomyces lilanjuaniae]